jgi:PAS domain S-box-containing protein
LTATADRFHDDGNVGGSGLRPRNRSGGLSVSTGPYLTEYASESVVRDSGVTAAAGRRCRALAVARAGAAILCLWLGVWLGGALALALGFATTLLILGGLVMALRQRRELEHRIKVEGAFRETQKRFTALINCLPCVVFQRVEDEQGAVKYSYFSDRLQDYLGISAAEAMADPSELFRHLDRKLVRAWVEMLVADPRIGEPHAREFEIIDPVGTARWVMVVTRSRLGEGGLRIWDGIATDISELKEWQQELIASREQAVLASRTKSQFLAVMSHELRTPLNAVIGFSEVLLAEFFGPLTDKQRDYLGDILQSGKHLLDIINDILDLAKIESGRAELHEDGCDAKDLAERQVELLRPRAERAGLTLEFRPAADLPLLYADPVKVKQMLLNLLSNAIKFTPPGGRIRVTLRLEATADEPPVLELSVADTGVGLAPADIPNAFIPFQQIDNRLARKHQGAGLGLPLVKAQIELHGGTIVMQSAPGAGTVVTLSFPAWRLFRSVEELSALAVTV